MDTLSRDSSSSSNNILPIAAIALGVIGLLIGGIGMFKATKLEKTLASQIEEMNTKVTSAENAVTAAAAKNETDLKGLRDGVQSALSSISADSGAIHAQLAKIEEQLKKPAPVVAPGVKGGKAVATGTVDANGNYTVAPGDTISKIAKKFATKVDSIEAENPGLNPVKLHVGQKIKIPKK
jgi:LysM repeat protein